MSTNKHATIRYHALDQCFGNTGRRYFMEDLIDAIDSALFEFTGKPSSIKRRQVFNDILFMESEAGWSIPLEKVKDGKRVYYRYSKKGFSIKKQAVNETEVKQINETLSILSKFKGMPQFEWMEEILVRIESNFGNTKQNSAAIVAFEHNPYLKGLNFFTDLFNAIQYKQVLAIEYKGFKQVKSSTILLHPYFLKEYNSRWFLFGLNQEFNSISNLALDRIIDASPKKMKFIENDKVDFEEFFEDVIGVTVPADKYAEKVILRIDSSLAPYIETKPIHGSQKIKSKNSSFIEVELNVIVNYELESVLFSLGSQLEVLLPLSLRESIKNRILELNKKYF